GEIGNSPRSYQPTSVFQASYIQSLPRHQRLRFISTRSTLPAAVVVSSRRRLFEYCDMADESILSVFVFFVSRLLLMLLSVSYLKGEKESPAAPTSYDEAMEALSSLITKRSRGNNSNKGNQFDLLFHYLKILELEDALDDLKIVHVAGTKGKGSTCTFTESILRNCGFRTGLFTSPHLIDVRERFRLDGVDISQEKFLAYFWWCFNRLKVILVGLFSLQKDLKFTGLVHMRTTCFTLILYHIHAAEFGRYGQERTTEDVPMPPLFRFLTLLAFKIFSAEQVHKYWFHLQHCLSCLSSETQLNWDLICYSFFVQVDVAILEVGLGGRFDATNVVQKPVVCGIASLGYDHIEILGDTLGKIAGEKAGILKVDLQVVPPLDVNLLNGQKLGLEGEHQYVNAGLAIALSFTWLKRTGHLELANQDHTDSLPEQFIKGLTAASFQGRAQIVPDQYVDSEKDGDLVFYLDGAHSPESMEICAKWFSGAVKGEHQSDKAKPQVSSSTHQLKKNIMQVSINVHPFNQCALHESKLLSEILLATLKSSSSLAFMQILLFNCMTVRDPELLLPQLMKTCASQDVYFKKALFAPNMSVYHKVGTHALPSAVPEADLSWQLTLQRVWDNTMQKDKGREAKQVNHVAEEMKDDTGKGGGSLESSSVVFPSLPLAIKWLRDTVRQNQSVRLQVLVTGSLHLVGDVLKLIRK
ncbi:unnamed protein product, partial [Linum tenue]